MLVTDKKQIDTYYKALLERDSRFTGIFYVGVKTTSIFCIATCRARKPKIKNVVFYTMYKEAMDAGFRPCKVCRPTENANEAPEPVSKAIELVRVNPKEKISDQVLRENNIAPEQVRRWFNLHYGMTFHAFQRMYRINNALIELKEGRSTIDTAMDAGYDSLSGFGYTCKKLLGSSPTQSAEKNRILISRLTTPLGPMFACATDAGLCLLEFVDRRMLETEFRDLQTRLTANIVSGENKHIKQTKIELDEYFSGERTMFNVTLDLPGTVFQKQVWDVLFSIPFGKTASYQQQAERLNNPKAVRAVASANGCNRVAIIVPCHRVIGKNGNLTGYGGGLERKRWLLEHENKVSLKLQQNEEIERDASQLDFTCLLN
ncbi:XRE family transcriptional regulator [Veronia nyctiphanis]|uniref:Methylated-DNA--protein-cysteine methyltransferase n=1 Tax=Veronia nyctiphanis TaxID=1278244 RepID=A0A4Q0YWI9_9GAMM|nr:XRE family transcriptional regulator [Veronia nyctiphanis]